MSRKKTIIEEYIDSLEEYEQKVRVPLTLEDFIPEEVRQALDGEETEEAPQAYLTPEVIEAFSKMLAEQVSTPIASCHHISHNAQEEGKVENQRLEIYILFRLPLWKGEDSLSNT